MDDFFVGIAAGGGQEDTSGVETKAGESLAGSVATPVLWSGGLLILDPRLVVQVVGANYSHNNL